jgi:hypothetical protein
MGFCQPVAAAGSSSAKISGNSGMSDWPAAPSPRAWLRRCGQWVAAVSGVPANGVAIGSQSGNLPAFSSSTTGPLSCGFGGAPRGIRTPNRQIRSQPSPVPTRPHRPFASPLVQVNGHIADPNRASVPARPVPHGRNLVAVSRHRRQTRRLATMPAGACEPVEHQTQIWCSTWRDENQPPASLKSKPSGPCRSVVQRSVSVAPHSRLRLDEEAGFQPLCWTADSSCRHPRFPYSGAPWDRDGQYR